MRDWIKRIIETLRYLELTDRDKTVFGSWRHGYRLDSPLSHDEIRKLEEMYELSLPDDYAIFLQEAGNGGAGPGYGLERFGYVAERSSIPTANEAISALRPVPGDDRRDVGIGQKGL